MSPRSFIIGFGSLTVVLAVAYFASFNFIAGAPIAAEYWLRGATHIKLTLASKAEGPKTLFVGGSSTLFSIDTAEISRATGRSVLNMGLHAGLPFDYHLSFAKRVVKPGDTIVLIPEYGYYRRDRTNTSWFINQVLSWGKDYYHDLGVTDKLRFVSETPVKQMSNAMLAKVLKKKIITKIPYRMDVSDEKVMSVFTAGWNSTRKANFPERRVFQYYYNNLNDHGDINNTVGSDSPRTGGYGLAGEFVFSSYFVNELEDFKKYSDANNIKLIVGFAPVMNDGVVTKNISLVIKNMDAIKNKVTSMGIDFVDSPNEVIYEQKYFFDTDSHLNIEGKKLRSKDLETKI